jgi:AcrR family transcriptional regulator
VVVEQHRRGTAGTSGAETRRRILAVALQLFAQRGYAGTSIRDITEHMGLTKAAVYYHFTSKEEILDAVTEPLRADFAALGDLAAQHPTPTPAEILTQLVETLSRRVTLIRTVMADPSAHKEHHHQSKVQDHLDRIASAIACDTSAAALLRARCAIGAAQFGAFATAATAEADHPAHRPLDADRTGRMIAGTEHLLDEGERAAIVQAALRALG